MLGNEQGVRGIWFSKPEEREPIVEVVAKVETVVNTPNEANISNAPPTVFSPPLAAQSQMSPMMAQGFPRQMTMPHTQNGLYPVPPGQMYNPMGMQFQGPPYMPMQQNMQQPSLTTDDELLSKSQMQEVLLKLIKNDRFVELLHSEYVNMQKKKKVDAEQG